MVDDTFAFIIHPVQIKKHVALKYPLLGRLLSEKQVNFFSRFFPPVYVSEVTGARSLETGREIKGWFIAAPYTPPTMMSLPIGEVYDKLVACGHLAEKLGANILGLGAYAAIVGDAGQTVADRLDIPVTTGDSYTVYMAVEAVREAARRMDIDITQATVAVVGATGAIGKTCAQMIANDCAELRLIGRRAEPTEQVRDLCEGRRATVLAGTDIRAIYQADLILTVTNALTAIIEPQHLKPGAVVCDVARPRDVSRRVYEERDDVLVIEGGMVEVPGPVNFNLNFGFPPKMAFACMAETMALAMDRRYEDYTLGKNIPVEQSLEIASIASRHGFRLGGFRSFEVAVSDEVIAAVRERAALNRKRWSPLPP